MALTQGNPPEEKRMVLAILFAMATSGVLRLMLQAMRNLRAPTTVAPALGCTRASPTSGARSGFVYLLAQTLELAAADVLEVHAIRTARRRFIEVDGDGEAAPNLLRHLLRQPDTILHRDSLDGNEGDDVGGADARVHAGVVVQVDQLNRPPHAAESGLGYRLGRPGEGDNEPVMVGVELRIENDDAGRGADRGDNGIDFRGIPALREVGDALDQFSGHRTSPLRYRTSPFFIVSATGLTPK